MAIDRSAIDQMYKGLASKVKGRLKLAVEWIVQAQEGTAYVQVTGRSDKAGVVRSAWVELR